VSELSGKYFLPFFNSLKEVLEQFGVTEIEKDELKLKQNMHSETEVNINVGLVDDLQGNVSYGMSKKTACQIVSAMLGGNEVNELDEMATSGLSELANMAAGSATVNLSSLGLAGDISPPTIILGQNLYVVISQVQTVTLNMRTSLGTIQIDVGLEQVKD